MKNHNWANFKAAPKLIKRYVNPGIVYYNITYSCIHGGIKFISQGSGIRQSKTLKMDCKLFIKLRTSEDGKSLKIISLNLIHESHGPTQKVYQHLPQIRKLNIEQQKIMEDYLSVGNNTKLLKQKASLEHEATVSVLCDENAWPEIIFVDGTYKLNDIGLTLFLFAAEDSNGSTEIVGISFIHAETKYTYKWMFDIFQMENQIFTSQIECFTGDKDLIEQDVIKEVFLHAAVYICLLLYIKNLQKIYNNGKNAYYSTRM